MPYRRNRVWYIDRWLPGLGRFGPLSTRSTRKSTAEAMEAMVVALSDRARHDVLKMIAGGLLGLPETYAAYVEGQLGKLLEPSAATEDNLPLIEAIESFLEVAHDPRYRSTFNWITEMAPADAPISWLANSETIQRLLNQRLLAGLKPATVARDKAAISAFLGYSVGEARRREILHRRVQVKQPNKGRIRWLTRDEIDRLRDISGDWWTLWCLLLSTGIRRGEALTAKVEDVDFEANQFRIWGTKSEAAERVVPLEGEIVPLLRGWIAANDLKRHDLLFPELGRNRGWYVWRAWRNCCEQAAIDAATVHDLRHSFAVHAVKSGMPLPELQLRLGHSRMQETWRYASFSPPASSEHVRLALGRMGLGELPTQLPTYRRKVL